MKIPGIILTSLLFHLALVSQVPQIKWHYDISAPAYGQAAMADLDGDSFPEIVFSTYMNDGHCYALNGENGSLLWKFNAGGCADAAPLIFDADMDGQPEVILGGSCTPKTWCLNGATGAIEWQANTGGTDSPPVAGDVDGDGKPEILHGQFNGSVICLNGEDGSKAWELMIDPNCSIQTSPALFDINGDGLPDFVVAAWSFNNNHHIWAFQGDTRQLIWESTIPTDVIYHGGSFADLDGDQQNEIAFGCYDNNLYVFNTGDGSLSWQADYGPYMYIGGPVAIGDLDGDQSYELVAAGWYKMKAFRHDGTPFWNFNIPGYGSCFRGPVLADLDSDALNDVIFATSDGQVYALNGYDGGQQWMLDLAAHYGDTLDIDHAPLIGDFDKDGMLEGFVAGGVTRYPNITGDYGRAYCFSVGNGTGPEWTMFQHDAARSCRVSIDTLTHVPGNQPSQTGIKIWPNPFAETITLKSAKPLPDGYLEIIGTVNGVIFSKNVSAAELQTGYTVNLAGNHLSQGLYMLRYLGEGMVIQQKLIRKL
jgi:outer membrane protein assembly factor BamB